MMALALLKSIPIHLTNEIKSHTVDYLRFSKTIYSFLFFHWVHMVNKYIRMDVISNFICKNQVLFQQITLLDIVLVDKLTPFNSMKITYHSFQLCYRAKQRLVFTIQIVSSEMRVSKAQTRSSAGNTKFKFVFSSEAEPLNAFSLVNYQL